MAELAIIKNGTVKNVIVASADFTIPNETLVDITDLSPKPAKGWSYDGSTFTAPAAEPGPAILDIVLDKTEVATGETITATAEIRQDGQLVDKNGKYFVPVTNIANGKSILLKVTFSGGQGSVSFSFADEGIYSIDMKKIRPMPTAKLVTPPEIVVADDGV